MGKSIDARKIGTERQSIIQPNGDGPTILKLQHVGEFYSEVTGEVSWLWDSILPVASLSALVAFMKVGKSTMVFDLARAVSRGEPYLGFAKRQSGVVILSVEEHPVLMKARLERYGVTDKDPIWITGHPSLWRHSVDDRLYTELREVIDKNNIGLVIIDSLSKFAMFTDENDNAEVTRFLARPMELIRETGATILFLHHEPKAGGLGGRNVRGGGGILAALDVCLSLQQTETGNKTDRHLDILGRYQYWSPGKLLLGFDPKTECYYFKGLADERALGVYKAKCLKVLDGEWQTIKDVTDFVGLEYEQSRKALKTLAEEGRVEAKKEGVRVLYRLPEEANGGRTE